MPAKQKLKLWIKQAYLLNLDKFLSRFITAADHFFKGAFNLATIGRFGLIEHIAPLVDQLAVQQSQVIHRGVGYLVAATAQLIEPL